MKNKLTIALLLAAVYLFWLLFSAPARLLTLALPDGARLGETTGTLWQGEARQASWRGFDIAHLRWEFGFSSWLPGWHIAFNDPSGLRGQAWLHGLNDVVVREGRLAAPARTIGQRLASGIPLEARGQVVLTLPEARFNAGGCRQMTAGTVQWRDAALSSPAGSLELAQVNGKLSCTPAGALAVALTQDSRQLSLAGQGVLTPNGRYTFNGTLQTRQTAPALLTLLLAQNGRKDEQGRTPWQWQGQWRSGEKK
ncbi:TPA: type II secretion system protein N [Klebsiella michiganensis]|uniref:type II secretion system protein N n=1 Tax=Klebsiella TaxID=570 RepID=UPI0007CC0C64|nr:type II secretion system protein N [Klebsiella michiganensis]ELS4494760.1 type II secretion system protein N [Klebsiella michiganensis]ELS4627420.1 type II secretion system protein N [Klebsiella michiganensis]ELT9728011.1 type II secretion system protein N [Klebsiella michiganensis]MBE0115531.1 type II secretion system protein N [Klebsiella michiganensis]MBL6029078.1 type II secretion system protein N [Klebsiella michiganensis]